MTVQKEIVWRNNKSEYQHAPITLPPFLTKQKQTNKHANKQKNIQIKKQTIKQCTLDFVTTIWHCGRKDTYLSRRRSASFFVRGHRLVVTLVLRDMLRILSTQSGANATPHAILQLCFNAIIIATTSWAAIFWVLWRHTDGFYNCSRNDFFNPNVPAPVNFVPFGTMRYSPFDVNLISITCILFVYLYFCLFLNKAKTFLFTMIYALSRYIIFLTFKKCDWLQIDTGHPQNGPGKLGLNLKVHSTLVAPGINIHSFIYSFTGSFVHSFIRLLTRSFIYLQIHSSIHPFVYLLIIYSFIHLFVRSFICSYIHSFIH